jgi:hypothetical protein
MSSQFVIDSRRAAAVRKTFPQRGGLSMQMSKSSVQRVVFAAFLLSTQFGGQAGAFHDEPKRAKAIKAPLVTAYQPCLTPSTHTIGELSLQACDAVRVDDLCGFAADGYVFGHAKAAGQAKPNGDFQVTVVARGLGPGCEDRWMCPTVKIRATTHRCGQGACTTVDTELMGLSPSACCRVVSGGCTVQTTINSEFFGTLMPGDRTGIEIYGIGLRRIDGLDPPTTSTFVSGVLTP